MTGPQFCVTFVLGIMVGSWGAGVAMLLAAHWILGR